MNGQNLENVQCVFGKNGKTNYSGVLRLATLEIFKWLPKEAFILTRTLPLDS